MPLGPLGFSLADRIAARPLVSSQTQTWSDQARSTVGAVRPSVPPPHATEAPALQTEAQQGARSPRSSATTVPPLAIEVRARDLLLQQALRSLAPPPSARPTQRERESDDVRAAARRAERRRHVQHYETFAYPPSPRRRFSG